MPRFNLDSSPDLYIGSPVGPINPSNLLFLRRFTDNGTTICCTEIAKLNPDNVGDVLVVCNTEIKGYYLKKLVQATQIRHVGGSLAVNCHGSTIIGIYCTNTWYKTIQDAIFDWSQYGVEDHDLKDQLKEKDVEIQGLKCQLIEKEMECNELKNNCDKEDIKAQLHSMEAILKSINVKLEFEKKEYVECNKKELEWCRKEIDTLRAELTRCRESCQVTDQGQPPTQPFVDILEVGDFHKACPYSPKNFTVSPCPLPIPPQLRGSLETLRVFAIVDQVVTDMDPPEICIYTVDKQFDNENWYLVRASEYGQLTTIVIYEGDSGEILTSHGNVVKLPFFLDSSFKSNTSFFVGLVCGLGLRFMFVA